MKALTNRERTLLRILGICVILIAAYYLLVAPIRKITGRDDDTISNRNELEILDNLYSQYKEAKQKNENYSAMLNKGSENITTMIGNWANKSGISKNLNDTRSRSTNVKKYVKQITNVKFEGVAIQGFLNFLYEVENSDNLIKVSELRIRPALKGTNTYDINMTIDNFVSK